MNTEFDRSTHGERMEGTVPIYTTGNTNPFDIPNFDAADRPKSNFRPRATVGG